MSIWAEVKNALNSTLGTSNFLSLDKMIQAHGTQTFTEDGTFTVPAGVTKILITAAAGGQAGSAGGGIDRDGGSGGNGGDCILKKAFSVTPGQKISITVGKGGTTGGAIGTSTVIGNLVTLAGGNRSRNDSNGGGIGGIGGKRSGYDDTPVLAEDGQPGLLGLGGTGTHNKSEMTQRGGGGGGSLGDGGKPGDKSNGRKGFPGVHGGGGGGGNGDVTSSSKWYEGGPGGDGIVIIEW